MPVFADVFHPPAPGPGLAVAAQTLLVFAAACIVAGWQTRLSLLMAALLLGWLGLLDLPGTFKKYSVIELHLLVLTAWSHPGAAWSIDGWLAGRRPAVPLAARWPRRLIQVLICAVYWGAAATKIRLAEFASGDLLEFALLDDLWGGRAAGRWIAGQRTLLQAGAFATLAFEILFPLLVLIARWRRPMLFAAVLFHLTLHSLLHLGTFSWVMLCGLMAFLDERDFRMIERGLRALPRWRVRAGESRELSTNERTMFAPAEPTPSSQPQRSLSVFLLTAGTIAMAGVAIQQGTSAGGSGELEARDEFREIPKDELDDILAAQLPAYPDMVRRLEVGTRIFNSHAVGDTSNVAPGATLHALARFIRQRPVLSTTWILMNSEGQEIGRLTKPLPVDVTHATAAFELPDDTPAGRYHIILQLDGVDAARSQFDVTR
jgi:hypothetical protein